MSSVNRAPSRASVRDVARLAGVSVGTVSNVLNGRVKVADATRERVRTAIAQLGFVPNDSARQLRTGRSRAVGLIVLDITNPFFTDLAGGVEDALWEQGVSVILCNSHESHSREAAYLETLAKQRVGGLIASPMAASAARLVALREAGIPVVLVDRADSTGVFPAVTFAEEAGGATAARHLVERGHGRVAYVGYSTRFAQVVERLAGARLAWAEAGRPPADLLVVEADSMTVAGGRVAAEAFLSLPEPRPTAVLCSNDLVAVGFLQTMTGRGLRVPDDVAIVGYDDVELMTGAAAVPLTSIRKPARAMGATAAGMLLREGRRLADDPHAAPERVDFGPELVVRAST